jgi:hypothetical protein
MTDHKAQVKARNMCISRRSLQPVFLLLSVLSFFCLFQWWDELGDYSLIVWFVGLCCLFHLLISTGRGLPPEWIRAIDYPYLFAGALALFFAFFDAAQQRHAYQAAYQAILAQRTTPGNPSDLRKYIVDAADVWCSRWTSDFDKSVTVSFCRWATDTNNFLESSKSAAAVRDKANETRQFAEQLRQGLFTPKKSDLPPYKSPWEGVDALHRPPLPSIEVQAKADVEYAISHTADIAENVALSMEKMADRALNQVSTVSPAENRVQSVQAELSFRKLWFWPFVLATAIALRLTKATADVFGWVRK